MASSTAPKKTFRIGVMLEAVQLSDIMGIDLFGNLSREYMDQLKGMSDEIDLLDSHAFEMEFYYMAPTLQPTFMTPGLRFCFKPNVTYDDCPRDLDIVITGGPMPSHQPPQAAKFMKEAWTKTRVWMTTCTGSMWLASTGLLDGRKITTNRGALPLAKQMYPGIEWLDQRWVVGEKPYDGPGGKGELWTAGGAGAGEFSPSVCLRG